VFKPVPHSSTVSSPASVQASVSASGQEIDKTAPITILTSSEDEESPFEQTVVSSQVETPQIQITEASTFQVQITKDSKAG